MKSMRARIVVLVLAAQMLGAAGAASLAIGYVHRALWASTDAELQTRMISALALVSEGEENPSGVNFDAAHAHVPKDDLFFIRDSKGGALAGNPDWMNEHRLRTRGSHWVFMHNGRRYHAGAMLQTPILDQEDKQAASVNVDLFYAVPMERTDAQLAEATRTATLVGFMSVMISGALTWWAVSRGMLPLTEFARIADHMQVARAEFEAPAEAARSAELVPLAKALEQLATRVREAFERERRFLSDAAHELKTAVAIQKSTLQLLEQGASENEYREGVARALEDTARTETLVADMLLLSSLEQEELGAASAVTAVNESLLNAVERLRPLAQMRGVTVEFTPGAERQVQARASELDQLWTNLLENAIQHSPSGSKVTIEFEAAGARTCRIRIIDCGDGISSFDLPHVFERFYRSDVSRSRATGGFGLGLSIVKATVEKLGGSIRLESLPHAGTTAEVELPIVAAEHGKDQAGA